MDIMRTGMDGMVVGTHKQDSSCPANYMRSLVYMVVVVADLCARPLSCMSKYDAVACDPHLSLHRISA